MCFVLDMRRRGHDSRYEEVDGVRKEKERLTTDHQPQGNVDLVDGR